MAQYKITVRRKPEIQPGGRLKRTGRKYYELAYIEGQFWTYKEFSTRAEVDNFLKERGL